MRTEEQVKAKVAAINNDLILMITGAKEMQVKGNYLNAADRFYDAHALQLVVKHLMWVLDDPTK